MGKSPSAQKTNGTFSAPMANAYALYGLTAIRFRRSDYDRYAAKWLAFNLKCWVWKLDSLANVGLQFA
jgi:hypothetical protein